MNFAKLKNSSFGRFFSMNIVTNKNLCIQEIPPRSNESRSAGNTISIGMWSRHQAQTNVLMHFLDCSLTPIRLDIFFHPPFRTIGPLTLPTLFQLMTNSGDTNDNIAN